MYFNLLVSRVNMKELVTLNGREVILAVADNVNIMGTPKVIQEMAKSFPALAWEEVVLTT